jgi:hypothetical protein
MLVLPQVTFREHPLRDRLKKPLISSEDMRKEAMIGGHYGWQTSFLLVATLATVAALGAKVMLPDVAREVGAPGGGTFLSHLAIVRRGAIFAVLSLSLLTLISLGLGGALCALVALVVLGYAGRISVKPVEQPEEG